MGGKTKTSFDKERQPRKRRGPSERTKIMAAMERKSKDEEGFYDLLVQRAFNPEDNFAFKELLTRLYPIPKQTMPMIEFEFNEEADPHVQASQIMKAASSGHIPPDVAGAFISSIASMLKIEEITKIKDEIEEIKRLMGESDG